MLTKPARVTVVPGTPGQAYEPASEVCTPKGADPNDGVDVPDDPPAPGSVVTPAAGTPILLEAPDGAGGYTSTASVAPAPLGYVCRYEVVWVTAPGSTEPAVQYNVVCTAP